MTCKVRRWTFGERDSGYGRVVHLDVLGSNGTAGCARSKEIRGSDEGSEDAGDGGKEAEDVLCSSKCVVHGGQIWLAAPMVRATRVTEVAGQELRMCLVDGGYRGIWTRLAGATVEVPMR
jgi:hypothetical protein